MPVYSWFFNCSTGYQGQLSKSSPFYVIAVRDGDIGVYSEPDSDVPEDCGDGFDNDGDGLIDCQESNCCTVKRIQ